MAGKGIDAAGRIASRASRRCAETQSGRVARGGYQVLERRLQSGPQIATSDDRAEEALSALRKGEALLEATQREGEEIVDGFVDLAGELIGFAGDQPGESLGLG